MMNFRRLMVTVMVLWLAGSPGLAWAQGGGASGARAGGAARAAAPAPAAAPAVAAPGVEAADPDAAIASQFQLQHQLMDVSSLMSGQRWREPWFGTSFITPLGSTLRTLVGEQNLLAIRVMDVCTINVSLRQRTAPMDLDAVKRVAADQLYGLAMTRIEYERDLMVARRPASLTSYRMGSEDQRQWRQIQGYVLASSTVVLVFDLECKLADTQLALSILTAMVESVTFATPEELSDHHEQLLKRGQAHLDVIMKAPAAKVVGPDGDTGPMLFRIVDGKRDVGYARLEVFTRREAMAMQGFSLRFQLRLMDENAAIDELHEVFMDDQWSTEVWSLRRTTRPRGRDGKVLQGPNVPSVTSVETGTRDRPALLVQRDGDTVETMRWQVPEVGYLPFVSQWLLGYTLSEHPAGEVLGYYSYFPAAMKLTFRTVRTSPRSQGGYQVVTRSSVRQPELAMEYDATGRLERMQLSSTRTMIRTTAPVLKRIWGE